MKERIFDSINFIGIEVNVKGDNWNIRSHQLGLTSKVKMGKSN